MPYVASAKLRAGKAVEDPAQEERVLAASAAAATFSLDDDLRPAIARISARMASLVVRVPRGAQRAAVLEEARADLASTGLGAAQIERLAIAGLGGEREVALR